MTDTIAAISSGNINQPISIIRLSGDEAFSIAKKIFSGEIGKHKTITFGHIFDGVEKVDEVVMLWFKGPHTFTGQDIVEINAHGGVVNTNRILSLLLSHGARLAERGEFMQRAFMSGKIDLVKAEGIHDLIFAQSEEQAKIAFHNIDGKTSRYIKSIQAKLLDMIATIETNIDYPEYDDIEELTNKNLLPKLKVAIRDIDQIIEASQNSKYIYEGVKTIIVGKPNVGKSSLLNALLNEDKAIVTNIPGTTRDVVEGRRKIGQYLFTFEDTAGIHETEDKIEKIGIEKSLNLISQADLVIHVFDSEKSSETDLKISKKIGDKAYIKVFNKSDLNNFKNLSISAKNKDIQPLIEEIRKRFKNIDINNEKIIQNTRQLSLINKAKISLKEALLGLKNGMFPDEIIVDLRKSWESISSILGNATQEELLDNMFRNFCLGK